jgi:hypothetical protein
MFAKMVGVFLKTTDAILFVGASNPVRLIAKYLKDNGKRVILIDSSKTSVDECLKTGLEAFNIDIYSQDLSDNIELNDVGYLIAMTGSETVNEFAVNSFSESFGEQGSYRLATSEEILNPDLSPENKNNFFTPKDDFLNLSEAFRDNPKIYEVEIASEEEYKTMVSKLFNELKSVLLFVKKEGKLYLIPEFEKLEGNKDNCTLIYLGKNV